MKINQLFVSRAQLCASALLFSSLFIVRHPVASAETQEKPLELLRMNPSGDDVETNRQVVFQFNRDVVPVGRMERLPTEVPIEFTPEVPCQWRWLNTTSLACQLDEKGALKPATRYSVSLREEASGAEAITLKPVVAAFLKKGLTYILTSRPRVTSVDFSAWRSPGTPAVYVYFDQEVTRESIAKHVYFRADEERRTGVEFLPLRETDKEIPEKAATWRIMASSELPLNTDCELRIEPGIRSVVGPELGAEDRVLSEFTTFPNYEFTGVECCDASAVSEYDCDVGGKVLVTAENANDVRCNPQQPISVVFSAPVIKETLAPSLTISPPLKDEKSESKDDPWENVYSYSRLAEPHRRWNVYEVNLPYGLRPYSKYSLKARASELKDEFGRALPADLDFTFLTDHRQPRLVFETDYSVLERDEKTHFPVAVQNLDSLDLTYSVLTSKGVVTGKEAKVPVDHVPDKSYYFPLKLRELLGLPSGVIQGQINSTPLNTLGNGENNRGFYVAVSPFNVHVKLGHFNTGVWVTNFADGKPISGAKVSLYEESYHTITQKPEIKAEGKTDASGFALLKGLESVDPQLEIPRYADRTRTVLKARVQLGNDLTVIPLVYGTQVSAQTHDGGYIWSSHEVRYGHLRTWGTTPQAIYKLGQTVQFKLLVRHQDVRNLVPAPREGYSLQVIDPLGKIAHQIPSFRLSEFGSYSGEFVVPESAPVGWYRFVLRASFAPKDRWNQDLTWEPMQVLVSDFTPAPFRASTELNGKLFRIGDSVRVLSEAKLHAGGPFGKAATRVTAQLVGGVLKPKAPAASGFYFELAGAVPETVFEQELPMNEQGELRTEFKIPESRILYGELVVESSVRDDRGKFVANQQSATFAGRTRYVGLNFDEWVYTAGSSVPVKALVIDEHGATSSGTPIKVTVQREETLASRVKGEGNAYLTQYTNEWKDEKTCELTSANEAVECAFTPQTGGSYRAIAAINDTNGKEHKTTVMTYVVGKGSVIWATETGNRLDIVPEKESYNVGDRARFLVKNPFPGARAMMTLERYGVMKTWFQELKESTEVIEVPVTPELIPGFYLSIVVSSPRVDKPLDQDGVDLGKPTFRMGYARIAVRDSYKELDLTVRPEREVYKPREKARVKLKVKTRQGQIVPTELAVAVLDESVFDLISQGEAYFDPYKGLYSLDSLDLQNFNPLTTFIGRRKFEKKGANSGGDGLSAAGMRSLFKFVSYWNPSIRPNAKGEASIEFDVPDNLTGWRVLAFAATTTDRLGLGEGTFKVNQPTELRPALPNQVTEGDSAEAIFTVMNRTDTIRTLTVRVEATGAVASPVQHAEQIEAKPYERYKIRLPIDSGTAGTITLKARAGDETDSDGLVAEIPVMKKFTLLTSATYGTTDSDSVSEKFATPGAIRTDVGQVGVTLSPSVISSVEGAFEYLRDYPYMCWEQRLTKGVMASHYQNLRQYIPDSFEWKDSAELPKRTIESARQFQAPNGGMSYYTPRNEYVDPYLSAYTAIGFEWLRKAGQEIPADVDEKLMEYVGQFLRRDVLPDFYSRGMAATVRAVGLAALAMRGKADVADLERYRDAVKDMSLMGKAHYLIAAASVPGTEAIQNEVLQRLFNQVNETGGKYIFQDSIDTVDFERLLTTPLRDNCAVLSSLLKVASVPGRSTDGEMFGPDNIFKLVRTISQTREGRTHWENTQENMFCMSALIDYSKQYERTKPAAEWTALFGGQPLGTAKFDDLRDPAIELSRALQPSDSGAKAELTLNRVGTGRVYYNARLRYAPVELPKDAINSGIDIRREYSVERDGEWKPLSSPFTIRPGELVRADIYVSIPAARNFVVVSDHVPGGLEPVNRDLKTASRIDAAKGEVPLSGGSYWYRHDDWIDYATTRWSFYHKELRHDSVRFYSDYLSPGNYHLSYVAQAIAPGEFTVLPVHSEEMYDPDVYGKGTPGVLRVEAQHVESATGEKDEATPQAPAAQ